MMCEQSEALRFAILGQVANTTGSGHKQGVRRGIDGLVFELGFNF
jgi:hypothetical protein